MNLTIQHVRQAAAEKGIAIAEALTMMQGAAAKLGQEDVLEQLCAIKQEYLFGEIGHFYAPIAFYGGKVLKYQGIVSEGNRAHLEQKHPGGVMLQAFMGDRIRAADQSLFQDAA